MSVSDEDHRQGRAKSLLTSVPRRGGGGLLAGLRAGPPQEDAALRHGRARARRERKPNPLLGAPAPTPREPTPLPEPAWEPKPALRPEPMETVSRPEGESLSAPVVEEGSLPPRRPGGMLARVVGLTLAGALAGGAAAFVWPKTYVATGEMLIAPGEATAVAGGAPLSADAALALVDNQLRVLRSGTMLNAVVDRLNLAADAEFSGAGGLFGQLSGLVAGDAAGTVEERRRRAVDALGRAVEVGRAGSASVVTVSAASGDPRKAALIANTISELFAESAGRQPGNAAERLAELRAAVAEAERAIESYKAQNELVDAQGRLITDDEIVRLGEQLSAARTRTVELNARAASTRDADVDSIVTGSLPEQYASSALADLRVRYAAARQQLDRASARLGPRHPERLAAQAELEGARQEISAELRRVASSLQTELKRAVQQEQELAGQLARMKVRQGDIGEELVRLRELERDAELKRSAYDRALQAGRAGGPSTGAASIISRAEPPLDAAGPSVPALSLAGALAGLLAGLGLAGWRRPEGRAEDEAGEGGEPAVRPNSTGTQDTVPGELVSRDTGKEADAMYPYPPHVQQPVPDQTSLAGVHHPYPQQAAPMQPPLMQQPAPAQQPGWPAAHYPAPPPVHPWWQAAQPQQPMTPPPYDPWAHLRAFAPPQPYPAQPYPAQAYAPQPYAPPPVQTVVYVPAPPPQAAPVAEVPAQPAPRPAPRQHSAEDRWRDQDAFVDERTNAAIEEIRQSLREFREAIEDLADERHRSAERRFGT